MYAIQTWSTESGQPHQRIEYDGVRGVVWSNKSPTIASFARVHPWVSGWDAETGSALATLKPGDPLPRKLSAMAFTPDDTQIVAADVVGGVHWWNNEVERWSQEATAQEPPVVAALGSVSVYAGRINAVAASGDGRIVVVCDDGTVRLVLPQAKAGKTVGLPGHRLGVLAITRCGSTLYVAAPGGVIHRHDLRTDRKSILGKLARDVDGVSLSADGELLAAVDDAGKASLFSTGAGELVWQAPTESRARSQGERPYLVALSARGQRLAVAGPDDQLQVWDLGRRELMIKKQQNNIFIFTISLSPHGELVAYGGLFENVMVLNVDSGRAVHTIHGGGRNHAVQFSPDGRYLASGHLDGSVRIFELDSSELRVLYGHQHEVQSVTFSADGASIASIDANRAEDSVRFWDTGTGEAYGSFDPELIRLPGVAKCRLVLSESSFLLHDAADPRGEVRIWEWRRRWGFSIASH